MSRKLHVVHNTGELWKGSGTCSCCCAISARGSAISDVVDIDRYAIIPKLTYSLLKKYGYRSPYTSSVSNYDRYLHSLLKEIGEEFNDTVITEVKVGGIVNRSENRK